MAMREVLRSVERQPLFENWVFYSWGIILTVGAAIPFIVLILFRAGSADLVPTVLLLGLAVFFFLFGQHPSCAHLTYLGYVAGLLCDLVAGASMIVAGVIGGRALHSV